MKRKFILASGDNSPLSERISITPLNTDDVYVLETGFPVSWAMVTDSDVTVYISKIYPDLATGFEITFSGASISVPFNVNVVYQ